MRVPGEQADHRDRNRPEITAQAWGPSPRGRRRATSHDPSCRSVHPADPGCTTSWSSGGWTVPARAVASTARPYFRGAFVTLTSTIRRRARTPLITAAGALALVGAGVPALASSHGAPHASETTTPIKHLVVLYQENVSFDHYFATYPRPPTRPASRASRRRPDTPSVSGLNVPPAGAEQPQLRPAVPAVPRPGTDLRPGPQLLRRAEGLRLRADGPVRRDGRPRDCLRARRLRQGQGPGDGLLRRQHRHGRCGTTPSTSR